jgi:multiple sugar transport system substrate-binding protein
LVIFPVNGLIIRRIRMMKRTMCLLLALGLLVIMITPLYAGGGRQNKGGGITLNYWAAPLSKPEIVSAVWDKVIADYKAETGVDVVYEIIPWSDTTQKLITAITSGEGPDLAGVGNNMSVALSPTGALLPLTSARYNKIGGRDKFIVSAATVTGEEGKDPVTIPLNCGSSLVVYDREAYRSVGMAKMPAKWEDFIAYAQKLTKDGVYGYALFGKPTQSWKSFLNVYFQSRGGKALDANGVPAFNSPEGKRSLQLIADLIAKYKIVPPVSAEWTGDDMIAAFVAGQVKAMRIDDENLSILDGSSMAGKFEIDTLPYIFPGETTGTPCVGHMGGTNIGIFSQTKYEEECLKFLEFVSRRDVNLFITDQFQTLSPLKGAYDGSSDQRKAKIGELMNTQTIPMPLVPYFIPSLNAVSTAVQNLMYQASTGTVDDAAIDAALKPVMDDVKIAMDAVKR